METLEDAVKLLVRIELVTIEADGDALGNPASQRVQVNVLKAVKTQAQISMAMSEQ